MRAPPPLPLIHKTRPHSASWAAPLGLPAGLPRGRGDGWGGAWWPTVSLVLPSALGVPSPQCLLEVPSSHTPSPASISDLLGSKQLPGPAAVTVPSCLHLLSLLHSQHGLEGDAVIGLPIQESHVPTRGRTSCRCCGTTVPSEVSRPPPDLPLSSPLQTRRREDVPTWPQVASWGQGLPTGIPATSSPFTKSTDNINRCRISNILVWLKKKRKEKENFFPVLPRLKSCWGGRLGAPVPWWGPVQTWFWWETTGPPASPEEPIGRSFSSGHRPLG